MVKLAKFFVIKIICGILILSLTVVIQSKDHIQHLLLSYSVNIVQSNMLSLLLTQSIPFHIRVESEKIIYQNSVEETRMQYENMKR